MTIVETPSGWVRGQLLPPDGDAPPVHRFRGIRYARPTVGELRLRPPVATAPWSGELDATSPPDRAIQSASWLAPASEPESEDSLALNVWTADPSGSAPVMVWLHGGSFASGSGSLSWYDGARLAERGVVVVTLNYRLGALGFLHLESVGGAEWAGSANLGLLDQTLALEWVRDHIGAFGGDPARVTLFGESAGAMSVSAHLTLPASRGLFHRAIAQSGAARHVQDADSGESVARRVLDELGVAPTDLGRLGGLPADAFRSVADAIIAADRRSFVPLPFQPTVDGSVLPDHPVAALRHGVAAHIPLLTGTTRDEINLFRVPALLSGTVPEVDDQKMLRRLERSLGAWGSDADAGEVAAAYRRHHRGPDGPVDNAELLAAVATDLTFRMPMVEMADAYIAGGGSVQTYLFTHPSTAFGGAIGAAHAIEIPFVFDNVHRHGAEALLGEITADRRRFAADLADRWVAFATGDDLTVPGSDTPWPVHTHDRRETVVLDLESTVVADHQADLRHCWLPSS